MAPSFQELKLIEPALNLILFPISMKDEPCNKGNSPNRNNHTD